MPPGDPPGNLLLRLCLQTGVWLAIMAGLLLGGAENAAWPQGLVYLAIFTKLFAVTQGFHPPQTSLNRFMNTTLESGLIIGLLLMMVGAVLVAIAATHWRAVSFGNLNPRQTMREVIPAVVLMVIGAQTIFGSFFLSVLGIGRR